MKNKGSTPKAPGAKGAFFIFLSAVLFSVNIALVKEIRLKTDIPVVEITFARFLTGLAGMWLYFRIMKIAVRPVNKKALYLRGILNALAVLLLFFSVEKTTVTNANVLNMTYPLFVALFSRHLIGEGFRPLVLLPLFMTSMGVWLIINPDFSNIKSGDIIGLASGVVAALAIIYLRVLRKTDETPVILFYLFLIGSAVLALPAALAFVAPGPKEGMLLLACSLCGIFAQYFLTHGYRFISAVGGSIVSASRVYIASLFGVIFFDDPVTLMLIMGTLLIVGSNIFISKMDAG